MENQSNIETLPKGEQLFFTHLGMMAGEIANIKGSLNKQLFKNELNDITNHEREDWGHLWEKLMQEWNDDPDSIPQEAEFVELYKSYRDKYPKLWNIILISVFG